MIESIEPFSSKQPAAGNTREARKHALPAPPSPGTFNMISTQ
jgi:hypothetical protein